MGRTRSFYVCQNKAYPNIPYKPGCKNIGLSGVRFRGKQNNKTDFFLEKNVKSLLDKYKNDPGKISEIKSCLSMYEINRSIALELNDKKSVKRLTKEFLNKLNQF